MEKEQEVLPECIPQELQDSTELKRVSLETIRKETVKVLYVCLNAEKTEFAAFYYVEPSRITKMRAFDKINMGQMAEAGELIIDCCVIKEASDERLLTDDKMFFALVNTLTDSISYYTYVIKKK
jgi:hypothetical protein